MFEKHNTIRQIKRINDKIVKGTLEPIDIEVLIKYVDDLKGNFDKTPIKDIYPIKAQCEVLGKVFYYASAWKNKETLKNASVFANNILVMTDGFAKNPEKAMQEYGGDLSTLRSNISVSLKSLIEALTVVIKELKERKGELVGANAA